MPLFMRGRPWQPPYTPISKQSLGARVMQSLERAVKGPMFNCRMCGNCVLQETAFICPMNCPKGLRNGPCGGSTSERCYVDTSRPCVWYKIYENAFAMHREELLLEVLPPLDWAKVGTDAWADVWIQVGKVGTWNVITGMLSSDVHKRAKTWDSVFRPVRQPAWWSGDDKYHAPKQAEPASELQRRLEAGEFVIAAEIAPPVSVRNDLLNSKIDLLKPYVTAINISDNPTSSSRASSWACSVLARERGAEPVMQMTARDRTRVGLQADAIGASMAGIRNILCIAGDSPVLAAAPQGRVDGLDVDAVQMLWILRRMRDEGRYLDGREIKTPPNYFLGAAASPFASEPHFQALREHKKVNAGAQFFQTNVIFDLEGFERWLNALHKRNIIDKVHILAGITPIKSLRMAQYMFSEVPGVNMPERVVRRIEAADRAGNAQEEGFQIAMELIEGITALRGEGIHGLHIMAVGWEEVVPRLVTEAHLLRS